jgi:hypothetical protein
MRPTWTEDGLAELVSPVSVACLGKAGVVSEPEIQGDAFAGSSLDNRNLGPYRSRRETNEDAGAYVRAFACQASEAVEQLNEPVPQAAEPFARWITIGTGTRRITIWPGARYRGTIRSLARGKIIENAVVKRVGLAAASLKVGAEWSIVGMCRTNAEQSQCSYNQQRGETMLSHDLDSPRTSNTQ